MDFALGWEWGQGATLGTGINAAWLRARAMQWCRQQRQEGRCGQRGHNVPTPQPRARVSWALTGCIQKTKAEVVPAGLSACSAWARLLLACRSRSWHSRSVSWNCRQASSRMELPRVGQGSQ